jgi:hypothetical protein
MGKTSISSLLLIVLNVAWWFVALAMALTVCLAVASAFHRVDRPGHGKTEIDIPVSFSVDAEALPVSAPSLGIERANVEHARGSLKFSPPRGTFVVTPLLLGLALMLTAILFVLGQLGAVFRTLRDGRPFVRANAMRIRWVGIALIAGEIARTAIVYSANSHAMTYFSANGLRFDARPDLNIFAIIHGLIILAIAEVFRTGTRLDEEQSLTI